MPSEQKFPSLKTLFADSWKAMTKSLLNVFVLSLIGVGMWFVMMICGVIGTVGLSFLSEVTNQVKFVEALSTNPKLIISLGIGGLVFFLATLLAFTAISIASVYAVANWQKKPRLGECLGQGFKLFFPLLLVNVFIGFISFGGWWLFLIPGILMMLFFMFARLEVIFAGKRFLQAIKGSVQIVGQHFGEILGRQVLIWVLYFIGVYVIQRTIPLTSFFYSLFGQFFIMAYVVVLYQQAKAATDEKQEAKMGWIWITSILGWLIFALFSAGAVKLIKTPAMQEKITAAKQQFLGGGKKSETKIIEGYVNSINSEAKPYWDQSVDLFKQIQDSKNDPTAVKKLNDQNITALTKASELDPNNPEIWSALCSAQTWLSTKGSLEDGLTACQKADELAPGVQKYSYGVGDMLIRLTRYQEAAIQLEKAVRINENSGYSHYSLGLAYKNLKMQDSAKTHLQKAIDLWSSSNQNGDWDSMILQARKELETVGTVVAPTTQTVPAAPSCTKYTIREGEFASDKCYAKKDYDDLVYYIQRFDAAAGTYNGAIASMQITCNGSDFIKNKCEQDKKDKADAEANINNYRGIINGIIAKGK